MKKIKKIAIVFASGLVFGTLIFGQTGCRKFVEIDGPPTSTNSDIVFGTDADATAVLTNLYIKMSSNGVLDRNSITSLSLIAGLSSDELQVSTMNLDGGYLAYYENDLTSTTPGLADYWTNTYNLIYVCNAAIEGLSESKTLTPIVKKQLMGEAKFLRGFFYFYLVNLYGDIPLNLTTNYKENSVRPRTDKSSVIQQIISDISEAEVLLEEDYRSALSGTTEERTRPNKFAASALLARVYLYNQNYAGAESEATKVINRKPFYDIADIDKVFEKNSSETIWALQPVSASFSNTTEATVFIPDPANPDILPVTLITNNLVDKFLLTDMRLLNWIGSVRVDGTDFYYAKKYKNNVLESPTTEYPIVLRLSEQYLIRAEARAKQGKISGPNSAESDLNVVRSRAGLTAKASTSSQNEMVDAIINERQLELFTEWGHRWLDLKRTGMVSPILQTIKGTNWQDSDQLYPIPQSEIDANPGIGNH